ncbi:MAG: hypothetical protein ABI664_11390 [bacterium]
MPERSGTGTFVYLALTLLAAATLHAQDSAACKARLSAPTPDSAHSTYAATIQSFNPRRQLPTTFAALFGQGFQQEFKLPASLVLPVYESDSIVSRTTSAKAWMAVPSLSVTFGITIDGGKISRIRRIAGVSDAAFDIAVARALTNLDSSALLPPLPEALGPDPLEISLVIARVPLRELHPAIPNPDVSVTPLFLVLSPANAVTRSIGRGAGFAKFIPQPPTKRDDEAVTVRVVVFPDGTVDQGSMQVIAYSSTGYIKNVFDAIPDWQFRPLMVNGCAVPAIEELTFTAAQNAASRPLR